MFKPAGQVHALNGVTAQVMAGRSLGVVGESGSGKSTFARLVMALERPSSGSVSLLGRDLNRLPADELRRARRDFQMVFQDPYGSLDPRQAVRRIVAEPLDVAEPGLGHAQRTERVREMLDAVGLPANAIERYPHEFSGGQRQRIAIARALITHPALIVADEAVSALDVSVQAQVLNLLIDLQEEFGVAYLFISHDLAVMRHISHRIAVMYLGRIVELTDKRTLFSMPMHPYTEALLSAAPVPDPAKKKARRVIVQGDVPSPAKPPPGCHFHTRCPYALPKCKVEVPPLIEVAQGHHVACLRRPVGASPEPLTSTV